MEYLEALEKWSQLKTTIQNLQDEERALRTALFAGSFPSPVEGTNKLELPDGRVLKGTHKLNRTLLPTWDKKLPPDLAEMVVRTKFELNTTAYRNLPEKLQKQVDEVLVAKPGMCQLEIVEAK
jgi:hypothetical protein